ncbi:SPOR domain-containing protein [Providencia manganoxydans]|uniref:SPOR domain-containing protein n=1 Tax=Providencia manganoxydans TaxID=2923283 RepID=UPI0032DBE18E
MDEFKPDNQPQAQNDLRPDTSDRPTGRSRQQSSSAKPKLTLSRQHIMIGVGVLVLLLLIIAISSALKAPTEHEKQQIDSSDSSGRNIDLSGSSSLSNSSQQGQTQEINMPPVSPTPTQSEPQQQQNNYGERIEIPGDVADALNQGQSINQGSTNNTQTQNIAPPPITQMPSVQNPQTTPVKPEKVPTKPVETKQPAQPKQPAKTTTASNSQSGNLMSAPAGNYTLQLSSASRSDTLEAFAKQHKLTNYKVYKTIRNGKTWYVLIHGNYRSVNEAKSAISTLPADIQAKKPWVRNMKQVQQDQK